jgi:dihydrofolate synthase/folylpolyglutamate synthase
LADPDPLSWLFGLERLGMKFGLDNMRRLCDALDHPERAFDAIIVAGTNGKGSVTAMTDCALRAAGHRVARYTSPHLSRLEERFVVDGHEVTTSALTAAVVRVQAAVEDLLARGAFEHPPTFFECTTATAFELFRRAGVALSVLEVGLGGRLDATNVVTPLAAAITSIALDHQAQLGPTLESIAYEKAGVIKPGVPIVCGPVPAEAEAEIARVAAAQGARLVRTRDAVVLDIVADTPTTITARTARRTLTGVTLALQGRHQAANAAVAIALLDELDALGIGVGDDAVRHGVSRAAWPGRLERFRVAEADVILDAAHNPAGAEALADHLRRTGWTAVTLVFGAMRDKDVAGLLAPLAPLASTLICTTPDTPRALPADELASLARRAAHAPAQIEIVDAPAAALRRATVRGGRVVVAGSIFLIGPLRDILR